MITIMTGNENFKRKLVRRKNGETITGKKHTHQRSSYRCGMGVGEGGIWYS